MTVVAVASVRMPSEPFRNTAGAVAVKVVGILLPEVPSRTTWTVPDPDFTSLGTRKLIWPPPTYVSGAEFPLTITEHPERVVGNGKELFEAVPEHRFEPNTVASVPGAMSTLVESAALRTPPLAIVGRIAADVTSRVVCVTTNPMGPVAVRMYVVRCFGLTSIDPDAGRFVTATCPLGRPSP
jgi:hypothetical protein